MMCISPLHGELMTNLSFLYYRYYRLKCLGQPTIHIIPGWYAPWKINMEPTNHPFRKENDLPNLHGIMFHVNLPGCRCNLP